MRVGRLAAIIWLCVLLAALAAQSYVCFTQKAIKLSDWLAFVPLLLLLGRHVIAHSETVAIWTEKAKLYIFNPTTQWSLEIRLELADDEAHLANISASLEDTLRKKYEADLSIERRTDEAFTFRIARLLSATASAEREDDTAFISICVLDMNVSYRSAVQRIEKDLCPLFQHIEHNVVLKPEGRKYALVAYFPDGNPYFGVFIQKLQLSRIDAFSLTIKTERQGGLLAVKRDRVELVARSLDEFRTQFVGTFQLEIGAI